MEEHTGRRFKRSEPTFEPHTRDVALHTGFSKDSCLRALWLSLPETFISFGTGTVAAIGGESEAYRASRIRTPKSTTCRPHANRIRKEKLPASQAEQSGSSIDSKLNAPTGRNEDLRDAVVFSTWDWNVFNVPERIALALASRGARVLYCAMPVSRFRRAQKPLREVAKGIYCSPPNISARG